MKKKAGTILGILAGSAAAATAVGYAGCVAIDEILFNRNLVPSAEISQKISGCDTSHLGDFLQNNLKWVEDYGYEKHYIISDRGEKLTGYLMKSEKESKAYVFCAHGYRSYGKKEFCGVAQFYLKNGINVFFPDHVASGESEGTYCTFGYNETIDCLKWLGYMNETFGDDIVLMLHGVSMGCATVTMMGARNDLPSNVKAIVADCGYSTAKELFKFKLNALGVKKTSLLIEAVNLVNKQHLGFDFEKLSPLDAVKSMRLPIFFIHGAKDALVPSYMVNDLYEACASEKKELLIVENADHAQSFMVGRELYEEKLGRFIKENVMEV